MKERMEAMARQVRDFMAGLAAAAFVAVLFRAGPAKAVTLGELAEDGATQIEEAMVLMEWVFYALAIFVGGWAILRFKTNLENQQRGGLALPVVGILVAVALASAEGFLDAAARTAQIVTRDTSGNSITVESGAPRPGGLIRPVVGIAFAVALATAPALIEALLEGLAIGHEPPVWRGERDNGFQPGEGGWR